MKIMDKNIYIVKQSDLIGQIKDFPIEVVQKMVERQYNQNGWCDVSVFQRNKDAGGPGFCWANTPEGDVFWRRIINNFYWCDFFDKYPKLQINCTFVVVDVDGKYIEDVQRMQRYSSDRRKFAHKNKVGDIYYIDVDLHGDRRVRFALANTTLAKEVMEKGVKFGDDATTVSTKEKSDVKLKSTDASTTQSLRDAIRILNEAMITPWAF